MKRRTIISIIISIICVIATCNFWCTFEPFDVSFDIKGSGNAEVSVYLSKVDSPEFAKTKDSKKTCNLKNIKKIDVSLERVRFPKRFKIAIIRLEHTKDNQIQISNIKFRNGKYSIDDLDKFKISGANNIKIQDGVLSFTSTEDLITLYYDKKLSAHANFNLNLKLFVIILVLSFLFVYKVTDYLADFKSVKGKSRLDIIFLLLFFVTISIPMLRINTENSSSAENRNLAKLKPIMNDKKEINENFGKDFDAWFSDRFFLRDELIEIGSLMEILNGRINNEFVIEGKEDWLFFKYDNGINNYRNSEYYTEEELKNISQYLSDINAYCKKHNKKFLFVVPPDKHRIYEEFYPSELVKKVRPNTESKTVQLFDYLAKNTDVQTLYLKEILDNAKKDLKKDEFLYLKKDTHWTMLGAYVGYNGIIKKINTIVPNKLNIYVPKNTKDNVYEVQDLVRLSPKLLQKQDKTMYHDPIGYDTSKYVCDFINNDRVRDYSCTNIDGKGKYVVTTYHDSFSGALENYYSASFKKIYYKWRYEAKASELKDSDIVILEVVERFVPKLIKLKFEEDN